MNEQRKPISSKRDREKPGMYDRREAKGRNCFKSQELLNATEDQSGER